MRPLKKYRKSLISHKSLATFARSVMSHTESLDDIFVQRQRTALVSLLQELDQAFQRILRNSFTQTLAEKDLRRDQLTVALRSILEAAIASAILDAKKAESAQLIMDRMRAMDSRVTKMGYLDESAELNAFIAAVQALGDDLITSSGATQVFNALVEAQADFDSSFNAKDIADETEENPRRTQMIRNDITQRLDALFSYINVNGIDLPDEYSSLIESLNGLIVEVMTKAKAEQTREENSIA